MTPTPTLPPTAAQTYLAEHEAELTAAVEAELARLRTVADGMKKTELMAHLLSRGLRTPPVSAKRDEWAEAWAQAQLAQSEQKKALYTAQRAAAKDTSTDEQVANIITSADKLVRDFVAAVKPGDPGALGTLAYQVKWNAGSVMEAEVAVRYARKWLAVRATGVEPRELGPRMARDVLRRVLLVDPANMKPTGHGVEEAGVLEGCKQFLRTIAWALPDSFPSVWWSTIPLDAQRDIP